LIIVFLNTIYSFWLWQVFSQVFSNEFYGWIEQHMRPL